MLSNGERKFIQLYLKDRKKWEMEYTDVQRRRMRFLLRKKMENMAEDLDLLTEGVMNDILQAPLRRRSWGKKKKIRKGKAQEKHRG